MRWRRKLCTISAFAMLGASFLLPPANGAVVTCANTGPQLMADVNAWGPFFWGGSATVRKYKFANAWGITQGGLAAGKIKMQIYSANGLWASVTMQTGGASYSTFYNYSRDFRGRNNSGANLHPTTSVYGDRDARTARPARSEAAPRKPRASLSGEHVGSWAGVTTVAPALLLTWPLALSGSAHAAERILMSATRCGHSQARDSSLRQFCGRSSGVAHQVVASWTVAHEHRRD